MKVLVLMEFCVRVISLETLPALTHDSVTVLINMKWETARRGKEHPPPQCHIKDNGAYTVGRVIAGLSQRGTTAC